MLIDTIAKNVNIAGHNLVFLDDEYNVLFVKKLSKLLKFLQRNSIDYNFLDFENFGLEGLTLNTNNCYILIPSKSDMCVNVYNISDKYDYCVTYELQDGSSCDWELSFRSLANLIKRFPNHGACKI